MVAKLLAQRRAIRLLQADGWTRGSGGKHVVKMVRPGRRPITLPHNQPKPYSRGLSAAILKQAGLNPTKDNRCISRSSSTRTERSTGRRSPSCPDASRQRTLDELREVLAEAIGLYLWDAPGELESAELSVGAGEIDVRPRRSS